MKTNSGNKPQTTGTELLNKSSNSSLETIEQIRRDYMLKSLGKDDIRPNPFEMFEIWFDEANKSELPDVNAMTLATCGDDLQPSCRIVLLKGVSKQGFVFYTNYESSKGSQLAENPRAALCFYWAALERQVRIEGVVQKVPKQASEEYFAGRPYESRIGAWASHQSEIVQSREQLEAQFNDMLTEFPDKENVPMPPYWGGYELIPTRFEFWQGRESRLHDRFEYLRNEKKWIISRLSP